MLNQTENRRPPVCRLDLDSGLAAQGARFFVGGGMYTKPCICCKRRKPLSDYYRHPRMADGHLGKCKECVKAYQNQRRRDKLEEIREYDRERSKRPDRKRKQRSYQQKARGADPDRFRGYRKKYADSNPQKIKAARVSYRKNNPDKCRARTMIGNAIRDGKIVRQPCEVCGNPKTDAHHPDYSRPLDVRWLCRKHHAMVHRIDARQNEP